MNVTQRNLLCATIAQWGLTLNERQIAQFEVYAEQLQRANQQLNLTAIEDEDAIIERHFLDSLRCAVSWGKEPLRCADIGSGAGFPGLPLKILSPAMRLTLVESVQKKATFLQQIVGMLNLTNVNILATRAEALGQDHKQRESYDLVTARAVADLAVLAEYCLPLVVVGGRFLAPKGMQIEAEVAAAESAIHQLGGRILAIETVDLPTLHGRTLVVIEKISPTPAQYPRRVGIPTKRPLG
jgi:16S rRNA (guanine527-N7)-methyltransferase